MLISFDDVGQDKVGTYGFSLPAPTPNIDALAAEGVLFRNGYAAAICSVSRAKTLTGLFSINNGIGTNVTTGINTNSNQGLDTAIPNIANVLRANGYRTAKVGKWHLNGTSDDLYSHPNEAGFDYNVRGIKLGQAYLDWEKCVTVDVSGSWSTTCTRYVANMTTAEGYRTTEMTNEAIAQLTAGPEPFFLYVPYLSSHNPWHDPPHNLHSYDGLCDENGPLTPTCHKAMTEAGDTELGRLLAAVDMTTTTVIFIGDNGTSKEAVEPPFQLTKAKGSQYEGGIKVPFIIAGQSVPLSSEGEESNAIVDAVDIFATIMEITGVAAGTTDSISMVPYLLDPTTPSIRKTLVTRRFLPNEGVPFEYSDFRVARNECFKIHRHGFDPLEFYNLCLDPFENNPLDLGNLTPEQTMAFNELATEVEVDLIPLPVPIQGLVPIAVSVLLAASGLLILKGVRKSKN